MGHAGAMRLTGLYALNPPGICQNRNTDWMVAIAQVVERWSGKPEVSGSNPGGDDYSISGDRTGVSYIIQPFFPYRKYPPDRTRFLTVIGILTWYRLPVAHATACIGY